MTFAMKRRVATFVRAFNDGVVTESVADGRLEPNVYAAVDVAEFFELSWREYAALRPEEAGWDS